MNKIGILKRSIDQKLSALLIAVAISAVVSVYSIQSTFDLLRKERLRLIAANSANEGILQLVLLQNDYLKYPTERAVVQWRNKFSSISKTLVSVEMNTVKGQSFRDSLVQALESQKEIVEELFTFQRQKSSSLQWEQRQAQLISRSMGLAFTASGFAQRLVAIAKSNFLKIEKEANNIQLVVSSLTLSIIILIIIAIKKSTQFSLANLLTRIKALNHDDEIGHPSPFPLPADDEFKVVFQELENVTAARRGRYELLIKNLKEAKAESEEANKAKSDFLANISHEIRTPLAVIDSYAALMLEQKNIADFPKNLEKIQWQVHFVTTLINDILDLAKVESGKMTIEKLRFSLEQELANIFDTIAVSAKQKGLKIVVKSEGEIPETIETDVVRFGQILFNLLGNAIKFTDCGSVTINISYRSEKLRIETTDTGIGIQAEDQKKLFKKFTQADQSITRIHGGTGLGLSLSKQLAIMLGGDVFLLSSEVGKGSTFVMEINSGIFDGQRMTNSVSTFLDPPNTQIEEIADCKNECFKGLTFLLAEDVPELSLLVSIRLRHRGAKVVTAGNGVEVCRLAEEAEIAGTPFDAILMDIQMPILDGYRATTQLRSHGINWPIFACTARVMKHEKNIGVGSGVTAYLEKPLLMDKLAQLCLQHCSNFQHRLDV